LEREGNNYRFRDQGSSNGSYINRLQVDEHLLASGDQIQLGRTLLLYTGAQQEHHDLSDQVNIVARAHDETDGSRIVHSVSHSEGSDLLQGPAGDESSPWLARARSNLQIMYR